MTTNKPPVPIRVVVEEDLFPRSDESAYILKTPARQMRITFTVEDTLIKASTYITMVGGKHKQVGETTSLYRKANEVMQRVANETGRTVQYTFGTRRPKLALWAMDMGKNIFAWDQTTKTVVDETTKQMDDSFTAQKSYYPIKKSEYS